MADNVELNAGSGGATIKTDDDGTAHWQYVKIAYGADDTQTIVTPSVGLPVSPDSDGFAVTNAGTFAVQVDGSALTALQLIDDAIHSDDAAFTLGSSKGVMMMGFAGTQSVDANDAGAISMETDGSIHIHDGGNTITVDGTVTANLSSTDNTVLDNIQTAVEVIDNAVHVDDAAFTLGTHSGMMMMGFAGTQSVDANDAGAIAIDTDGAVHVSDGGNALTVDGEVTANLSATDNAVLDDIASKTGSIKTAVEIIDNAISGSEMQVDVVAALPAGSNTIGVVDLGSTDNAVLDDIASKAGSIKTAVEIIDNAISGSEMQVDVVASLPAGTNNIGDVDIASIAAGDNNIGNVDIASALPAGDNNIGNVDVLTIAAGDNNIGNVDIASIAAGTNLIGDVGMQPRTSGGISSVFRDEDIDQAPVAVKAGAGQVYWIHVVNFDATPVYLHLYDVAQGGVTVGTTGEKCSFAVPSQGDANGAGFTMQFPHGIEFSTAITAACTTAIGGTSGPGTNEVILNIGYE